MVADRAADASCLRALLAQIPSVRYELEQIDPRRIESAIAEGNYTACVLDFQATNPRREALLYKLLEIAPHLPAILLTETAEAGRAALQLGGADYWEREDLSASLIERSLRLILAQRRAIAEVEEELQANQQALQQSEQRLYSILGSLDDVVWSIDPDINKLLYLNSSAERVYGRTLSEFFENLDLWRSAIHPNDRERVCRADLTLKATQTFDIAYRIVRPDGKIRWLRERTRLIDSSEGMSSRRDSVATEITTQKQIEDNLRDREERLRLITNALPVCIAYVDAKQRYRFANQTYTTWFGYPPQEIYGKHLREILGEEAYNTIRDKIERVLAGKALSYEVALPYQQGGQRDVKATLVPDRDAQDRVQGYYALIEDISQRKRAENSLRHRLTLETALAQISTKLATNDTLAFNELLQKLGEAIGANRSYLLGFWGTGRGEMIREWCDENTTNQMERFGEIDLSQFPWWCEQLKTKRDIVVCNVESLPNSAIAEKNYWRSINVAAVILVPIYLESGQLWGQLGFESSPNNPKSWSEDDAQLLHVVGEMLSGYWARQQRRAEQLRQSQYQKLLTSVTFKIRESLHIQEILQTSVTELQRVLSADRVLFWHMTSDGSGTVVNESVKPQFPTMQGLLVVDTGFSECLSKYSSNHIYACADVALANFSPCYLEFLQTHCIRANLAIPILCSGGIEGTDPQPQAPALAAKKLWGLLCVQQCSGPRYWTHHEIEFLTQVSDQLSIALSQAQLLENQTRYTRELARSNRELEQFAYIASHDLQEPLRGVISFAELLEEEYQDDLDANARQYLDFIVDGATRMRQLIKDLLAFSRVGTRKAKFTSVNCEKAIATVLANLSVAISESSASITYDPLPTAIADPLQLIQLWQNLISNAIKFRAQNPPQIHLSATPTSEEWLFSVSDNGIGIDPQYGQRIFAIFQRLHSRSQYEGTGIGLAICQRIVQRHGGRIWVESAPEQGATFYFTLPRQPDQR